MGALLAFTACAGDGEGSDSSKDDAECETGDEGCACYPNKTCNGKLSCYSKRCVDDTALGDDKKDDSSKPSGDDSDAGEDSADNDEDSDDSDPSKPAPDPDDTQDPDPAGPDATEDTEGDPPNSTSSTEPNTPDDPAMSSSPEPTPPGETPVGRHGQLHVEGTQLTDEHGVATQLKGISSMWLNWEPTGYAESIEGLRWMRDNWNLQIIRAAMGVAEQTGDGAYIENPEKAKAQVRKIVQNAVELGVYVIIDWHDHHAQDHQGEAEAFFSEMAQEYADVPNVLYELYNEPLDLDWDSVLKPYHTAVSAAIRAHDTHNVIIMGTPNWSQDVDVAALNPVAGSNLMYTLHFYACDHTDAVRAKGVTALANGLPIFVTEWGATPADGGTEFPTVCEAEATAWHDWLDREKISWAAWKLDGCSDSSCIFVDRNVPVDGGWTADMLNGHAPFVISRMKTVSETPVDPGPTDPPATGCTPTGSCVSADRTYCDADGNLLDADCRGCGLLSCSGCCEDVGYFGATDTQGSFTTDPSLITEFTQTDGAVVLRTSFTAAEQMGAIAFKLASAVSIDPYAVVVQLAAEGGEAYVTLENGSSGCMYPLLDDTLGIVLYVDAAICWEGALPGDPVTQINVRIDSVSSGVGTLTFHGLSW